MNIPSNSFFAGLPMAIAMIFAFGNTVSGQEVKTIRATVIAETASGTRITSAEGFIVSAEKPPVKCLSDNGEVKCEIETAGGAVITIFAPGFEPQTATLTESPDDIVKVVLYGAVLPSVTVTFERARVGGFGRSEVRLSNADLAETAAPLLDDALRQTTGFSTFRRNSGRQANPTTQGVSLRGVGSSGASRTVVNEEDTPVNDPFGGWVQWNRIIPIAVRSIDVERGGSSGMEGSGSVSGVITVRPRLVDDETFSGELSGGSQRTASASAFAGFQRRGWMITTVAARFQTRGFVPVEELIRGRVDSFAGVRYNTFNGRVQKRFGKLQFVLKPNYFGEVRTNGTGLQTNRTHSRQMSGGVNYFGNLFLLRVNAFAGSQVYDQIFSSVSTDRNSESLTRIQRTPATNNSLSVIGTRAGRSHSTSLGYEVRNIRGASDEIVFSGVSPTTAVGAGGRENTQALFVTQQMIWKRLSLAGALRYDRWKNHRGLSVSRNLATNVVTRTAFTPRADETLSPRVSSLFRISSDLYLFGSLSKSFRAPTLNELYRSFRVGNIITQANSALTAEMSTEYEAGASYRNQRFGLRGSAFYTSLKDAVANVTISTTPSLITRQRRNAGRTVSKGVEVEVETKIKDFGFSTGYLFADSTVQDFPSNTLLVGKRIPQVPVHQATFQIRYATEKWTLSSQMRTSSAQFDDDLNTFRLEPYFQADGYVSYKTSETTRVFVAIENIFNSRYSTAKTPVRSVSGPVSVRVGVRIDKE